MRGLTAALLLAGAAPAGAQDVAIALATETDGSRTLSHALEVPAPIEAVWQAVATAEGWRSWAVPLVREYPGTDRFETSYDAAAAPGGGATIEQQWLAREAPRKAVFRTVRAPAGFPHAEAYRKVVSTFTLEPHGRGATRVRLSGAGYPAGAAGDALIAFFRAGNGRALRQLHARFATGPINWTAAKAEKGEE